MPGNRWDVIDTDDYDRWFCGLDPLARRAVIDRVSILELAGPTLGRPHADAVHGSRHPNMKELIVPHGAIRVFFAFDPRRRAVLLIGGSKRGSTRFYERMIRRADRLFDEYLARLL